MAGHSHWATIKRAKGAADAKRGQLFSKLSRAIIVAARAGGGDPETNLKLRYAIEKARQASMPKENIDRAIKKGTGESSDSHFEEITYEGYGPGGVAIMVDVATDNRNRTAGELRKIFEKGGGKMGSAGSVAFQFERKGLFAFDANTVDEDRLMEVALEAGADDVRRSGNNFEVTCDPPLFNKVQEAFAAANLVPLSAEITQLAKAPMDVDPETARKVLKLMETLDEHDDVQNVYSTLNITPELAAAAAAE
ncbi:MAG: YebC/PmpR family DNA-binding transcriptional regulator [Gemmatales bacterium]|nr:YebC/PmpR family DNA-binding transcriptional regulator [Gemmatales bacterium]MDW8386276.1 YebC/PmpR family DNA-binding transcriptional regulator [Gemmatales bacterium]